MVKKGGDGGVIKKIADLHAEKKLTEITNIEDHSDRRGMRVVIELKRDANPKVVLNKLYKHTALQTTFGVNMVALVDNVPRTLPLRSVIHNYVQHQREVIVRRSKHELRTLEARVHRLEGLLIALDHLDEVIALIRGSRDRDVARAGLMERYGLTQIQAQAILDLRLQQLTALEADAIKREHADLVERIGELRALLGDEEKVLGLIKEELEEIADRYGDERRTVIAPSEDDLDIEDLIADQQMVIAISHSGYIKSLPLATYRQQRRGGVGITGMDLKEDDYIEHLFVCSTHDFLLFFTNRGKVYRSKVYDLPEAGRTSKGRYLGNVLPLREGERVQSVLATRDFSETKYLMFGDARGHVKKTEFAAYNTPIKADGIIAIKIRDDDELVAVRRVDHGDEILMVSHAGLTVRFPRGGRARAWAATPAACAAWTSPAHGQLRAGDGRRAAGPGPAGGHRGRLRQAHADRRVPPHFARRQGRQDDHVHRGQGPAGRGAGGARARGPGVHLQHGMVQRTGVRGINRYGRPSQGVRVMNLREGDEVSAVALVVESERADDGGRQRTRPSADRAASIEVDAHAERRRRRPTRCDPPERLRRARPRSSLLCADQRKGVVRS